MAEEAVSVMVASSLSAIDFVAPAMTLLAAIIGGAMVWRVHRINMIRSAKAEFITSVYTLLEGIYPEDVGLHNEVFQKLREAQPGLHRAVAIFRFYLAGKELTQFDQAWRSYTRFYPECTKQAQTVHAFYGEGDSPYRKLCNRIDALLEFAKT